MPSPIRLVLALHNHQPIGNFEHVFQQAYEDSYLPFLDVFSRYETLRIALHTSGSLMEWLDAAHPEYVDRLAELAAKGRIEIIGGAFFEPILAMIPSRDRVGQIRKLHPLAAKPARHDRPRHVDARTGLGAIVRPRPGRRRHRVHDPRRLPFQEWPG